MREYPFPKVELHCHLDGSFRPETLYEFAARDHVTMPAPDVESYRELIKKQANAGSVNEFLKMFDVPVLCMQTKDELERFTFEMIEDLRADGVAYAEIRFAPQLHTQRGLTQADAIEAVLAGREKAMKQFSDIQIGILACMMCQGTEKVNWDANMETVETAAKYYGYAKGLVGVDLAGAEGFVPLKNFAPLFERAKELGLPYTCHAGDSQGPDTVEDAMNFGSKRIGHGHHLYSDPALVRRAAKEGLTIEICPTSNVQCLSVPSYEEHPAKNLLEMGIHVTINTDNRFLSGVTLSSEYEHCLDDMGFTYTDLIQMNLNAINAAFCPEEVKEPIREKLKKYLKKEQDTITVKDPEETVEELAEKLKSSEAAKKVLGADGKLSADDAERLKDEFVSSKSGQAILGEDGKLGLDDLKRFGNKLKRDANEVSEEIKDALNK